MRSEAGDREKSRVDRPGEAKQNPDLAEKMQRCGYHDQSPSTKNHFSKSLRVSGAFKRLPPQYAKVLNDKPFVNYYDLLLKEITSFRITKQILL
jgi:hypothetical protein